MTFNHTIISLSLSLIATGLAIASLLGYLGRFWWRFELFNHFRVQYLVLAVICGLGLLLARQLAGFFLCIVVSLINLVLILPLYQHPHSKSRPAPTFRILTANILGPNEEYEQISHMLEEAKPDLALLVEFTHHHQDGLKTALQGFPHTHFLPHEDNYGLALLSRLPMTSTEISFLNEDDIPVLVAHLELDGHLLTIIGTHTPPPKSQELTDLRDQQVLALALFAAKQEGEVILLGDLNTTSWSYTFKDLLRESGLRDSRSGFGIQPTWPENMPLMRVPIDHVLHSPGIHISHRCTGPFSGSDHRPVIVDFCLRIDAGTLTNPIN